MKKHEIRAVLKDYHSGKLDKYEAMDALDLDSVRDLLNLCAECEVPPEQERAYFQSDPTAQPIKDLLSDG